LRQRPTPAASAPAPSPSRSTAPTPSAARTSKRRKLSYKETQELEALPDQIDAVEAERTTLYAQLADPIFLRDGTAVTISTTRLAGLDAALVRLTERWEELELIVAGE